MNSWREKIVAIPEWIWAPSVSAFLLMLSGGLGLVFRHPWLFPSLGPSALLHAWHPKNPAARFYNTMVGHLTGIAAGFVSVFIFHAATVPAVLSTEELSFPRWGASVLATFLTVFGQARLKAFHPPAAATTLLITLGAFKPGLAEIQILIVGVLIVATFGEGFRQIRI